MALETCRERLIAVAEFIRRAAEVRGERRLVVPDVEWGPGRPTPQLADGASVAVQSTLQLGDTRTCRSSSCCRTLVSYSRASADVVSASSVIARAMRYAWSCDCSSTPWTWRLMTLPIAAVQRLRLRRRHFRRRCAHGCTRSFQITQREADLSCRAGDDAAVRRRGVRSARPASPRGRTDTCRSVLASPRGHGVLPLRASRSPRPPPPDAQLALGGAVGGLGDQGDERGEGCQ